MLTTAFKAAGEMIPVCQFDELSAAAVEGKGGDTVGDVQGRLFQLVSLLSKPVTEGEFHSVSARETVCDYYSCYYYSWLHPQLNNLLY